MLLELGAKFVDPKQHQLSLQAFVEVNRVPLQHPRVKITMLMRAYRKPSKRGWRPLPEPTWSHSRKKRTMHTLEALLRSFQRICKPAVAGMVPL